MLRILFLLICFCLASLHAADSEIVEKPFEYEIPLQNLISYFYLYENPDLTLPIIETLKKENHLADALPFLASVFRHHPSKAWEWTTRAKLDAKDRKILMFSMWAGGLDTSAIISTARKEAWPLHEIAALHQAPVKDFHEYPLQQEGLLNSLWQAFYATGENRYPLKVLDMLEEGLLSHDPALEKMASVAESTLVEHAYQHEKIYRLCQNEKERRSPEMGAKLKQVLDACCEKRNTTIHCASDDLYTIFFLSDRDDFGKRWLRQNRGEALECKGVEFVAQGGALCCELLIANYTLDKELKAHVTYDVALYGPDDELIEEYEDIPALTYKIPSHFLLQRPQQWVTLHFEKESPLGKRTVVITIKDYNAGVEDTLSTTFEVVEASST